MKDGIILQNSRDLSESLSIINER